MATTPAALAASLVNRALAGEDWARAKLAPHAGRIFTLEAGPLAASFAIAGDGSLGASPSGAAPALTLTVSPLALPALAAEPSRWTSLVRRDGDEALASALEELALTLPWFVERAFGALLGPVVGQRVADAGRTLLSMPGELSRRAAGSLGDFAGESDLVASRGELEALAQGAADVDARLASLAARVARLEADVERGGRERVA
jgi:ubiquinone biosynthesis protein UbiJ